MREAYYEGNDGEDRCMSDNELLLAISEMMDKKLAPINERLKKIELTQENDIAEHSEKLQKLA